MSVRSASHSWFILLFLLALAASRADARQDRKITNRTGSLFRITCHFDDRDLAGAALETAQAVFPWASPVFGTTRYQVKEPLHIHLYREAAAYVRVEARVTGGMFRHNLAFSSFRHRNAHVAMQPGGPDELLEAVGLPVLTRRQIAHEAAHLLCFATLESFRDHPEWFSEGAAMWVADQVMRRTSRSPGLESDPVTSTRILLVQKMLETGRLPSILKVIQNDPGAVTLTERYALHWLLFNFLRIGKRGRLFNRVLWRSQRLAPGRDYVKRLERVVVEIFGREGLQGLDGEFARYVRGLEPVWEEVGVSLEIQRSQWRQMAFSDASAMAWRTEAVKKAVYSLGGSLKILPGYGGEASLFLGRDDKGFLAVTFTAGTGVQVRSFQFKGKRWKNLVSASTQALKQGETIPFRVFVRDGSLRLSVGGKDVLAQTFEGRSFVGLWGIGVSEGSAAEWDSVRLRY